MSERKLKQLGLAPLARIVGYGDAEVEPIDFCIAPSLSGEIALRRSGLALNQIDLFEFNEAFATTVIANIKKLQVDPARVNPHGGAIALGHPLG